MARKKKFTKTDIRTIFIGILLLAGFIAIRYYLTNRIAIWLLGIFDTMIAIFGVGILVYLLNEILGKAIINRLTRR